MHKNLVLICFLGLIPTIGCGGRFTKREHFVAYGGEGEVNYYRITIRARGPVTKVDYRSGWFDAEAIDRLFGDVAARRTLEKKAAEDKGEAALGALDKYLEALTADKLDQPEIEQRKKAYEDALNAITGLAPAGTDRLGANFYANKKLVMIMANDPTAIIEAIKDRIQGSAIADAVAAKLHSQNRRAAADARSDLGVRVSQIESVVRSIAEAEASLEGRPAKAKVRQTLRSLVAELEAE